MQRIKCLISALVLTTLLCSINAAQTAQTNPNAELRIVVGEQQVLFTALRPAQELRLEIFNQAGEAVYDSGLLSLTEFTWNLRDANGAELPPGLYSYTLSLRSAEAEMPRKHPGHFIIEQGNERFWLTAKDATGVGAEVTGGELTVARTGERTIAGTSTGVRSVADGRERLSGREIEGRKLAEENQESLKKPGTINLDGGGTTNRLVKWLDGDSLTDSVVTDTGHLTIDSSSNMQAAGTGTLIIQGSANKERVELQSAGVTPGPALQGRGFGGTIASPTATLVNTDLFIIGGSGHNSSGLVTFNAGTVKIKAEQNWTPTANGSYINFETTPSGSPTSARAERMRITGSGRVGIGTNNPALLTGFAGKMLSISDSLNPGIALTNTGTGGNQFFLYSSTTELAGGGTFRIYDATNGTDRFVLNNFGDVGIGTTPPLDARLQVDTGLGGHYDAVRAISRGGGYGVYGDSGGSGGAGVYGVGSSYGVQGYSASGTGVQGSSSSTGYAGYFLGKVRVTGVLEKPGGGFKIDHPLEPENKYLIHSFVESPDMKNLYDGTVTTDANGEAQVTLPEWFAALNRDFRYQLTVIGVFAQAIIAEEIKEQRFKIRTSLPQVKVSWQVTGIRQDAWANQNRLPVEELKPAVERGSYQNPAAFGQPEERSIEWARNPARMKQQQEQREKAQKEMPQKEQP